MDMFPRSEIIGRVVLQVTSSLGRGRALVRVMLMEHCLADAIQHAVSDGKLTRYVLSDVSRKRRGGGRGCRPFLPNIRARSHQNQTNLLQNFFENNRKPFRQSLQTPWQHWCCGSVLTMNSKKHHTSDKIFSENTIV